MREKNRFFYVGLALGFILAFIVFWFAMPYLQKMAGPQPAGENRTVSAQPAANQAREEMAHFLQAAEAGDFETMRTEGRRIFTPGRAFPDSAAALAPYKVNSYPPYVVYAFMTENAENTTRRVLLTMDDHDKVESFLAEEMAVVP